VVIFERRVPDLTELALSRFVDRARLAIGLKGKVDVLVTSSSNMKVLNQRFRGMNKPTDVLSFPVSAEESPRKNFAGEIAISADIALGNARALGHSGVEEVKILVLHGILHLRGYDHERDHGQMARRESQLRSKLRLPVGLIERAGERKQIEAARSGGAVYPLKPKAGSLGTPGLNGATKPRGRKT